MKLFHYSQRFLAIFRFCITYCTGYCFEMSAMYFWYRHNRNKMEKALEQSALYLHTVEISLNDMLRCWAGHMAHCHFIIYKWITFAFAIPTLCSNLHLPLFLPDETLSILKAWIAILYHQLNCIFLHRPKVDLYSNEHRA